MEHEWKIGFVVEGEVDKAFVEELARRVLSPKLGQDELRVHAVRLGSEIALPWAYSSVLMLLEEKEYQHVLVVMDADTGRRSEAERKRHRIEDMMREHHLTKDEVSVCIAVPEIEAWLLAEYLPEPEKVADDVVDAIDDERFLILPHPEVEKYFQNKANDYDRWLGGMRKLNRQARAWIEHISE